MSIALPDQGRLAENIIYFCRALRRAGIPVGPGQTKEVIRAVAAAGVTRRADFYYTLQACLITRAEQRVVFAEIFRMFWRDPEFLETMINALLPVMSQDGAAPKRQNAERRAAEALLEGPQTAPPQTPGKTEYDTDAQFSFSKSEKLKHMDFELMSLAETEAAKAALARLDLPVKPLKTRRYRKVAHARRINERATLQAARRRGGEVMELIRKAPKTRPPDLVAICDISGSMSTYSRMFMHFLHAVAQNKGAGWSRVHSFTLGTELTNVTRILETRDVDQALSAAGAVVHDWDGGTRLAEGLARFNKDWSRRVTGRGAVVLLITDGLERGDLTALGKEAARLKRSCHRLIWLNPLLRYDAFAPQAGGIRALLPHVDSFHSCHNLASIADIATALSGQSRQKDRMMALL